MSDLKSSASKSGGAIIGLVLGGIAASLAGCASDAQEPTRSDAPGVSAPEVMRGEDPTVPSASSERSDSEVARSEAASDFDREFQAAAIEFDVPAAVLKAIAWTETRYSMVVGEEEHQGRAPAFGLMALSGARLEEGARLANVSVEDAKQVALANVRAAAALLSSWADEPAIARGEVAAWEPIVARFSGIELPEARAQYVRDSVFKTMKNGLGALTVDPSVYRVFPAAEEFAPMDQLRAAGPDYAGSVWRSSPNWNSRGGARVGMVIIHTCEGGYSGCWSWLTNPNAQASAHYVVREDGMEVTQLVAESNRAWHIAASYNCNNNDGVECNRNGTSSNNFTVGIEHGGYASQKTFPAGQLEASAQLVCNITKDHGIPRDRFHIVGHGKLQPYDRTDPGPNWPWAKYITRIGEICGTPAPPPPPAPTGQIVIDSNNANNDPAKALAQLSGNWTASTNIKPYFGSGYFWADTAAVSDAAEFSFYLPANETRTVDAYWPAAIDRSPSAPFVVFNSQGARIGNVKVDQRTNGSKWNELGTFAFTAGWNKVVLSRWTGSGAIVVADAVRIR